MSAWWWLVPVGLLAMLLAAVVVGRCLHIGTLADEALDRQRQRDAQAEMDGKP